MASEFAAAFSLPGPLVLRAGLKTAMTVTSLISMGVVRSRFLVTALVVVTLSISACAGPTSGSLPMPHIPGQHLVALHGATTTSTSTVSAPFHSLGRALKITFAPAGRNDDSWLRVVLYRKLQGGKWRQETLVDAGADVGGHSTYIWEGTQNFVYKLKVHATDCKWAVAVDRVAPPGSSPFPSTSP
jgi:hypothetical protein